MQRLTDEERLALEAKAAKDEISDAELLLLDADRGLRSLYHLNAHVLRFGRELADGTFFQMPRSELEPVCRWLQTPWPAWLPPTGRRKRFLALPRGTTKTSVVESYVAQRLLENPNLAVFFTSEEKKLANRVVKDLADRLASEAVAARYGNQKAERDWTFERFTLATRRAHRKDPSVMAGGVDVPVQGWHFNLVVCDDLQGLTNNTPEGIAKIREYLSLLWPVLDPGGELIWICTRWDWEDVASEILKQVEAGQGWEAPGHRGFFGALAVPGDEGFYPHAVADQPLYPSVLPLDELERLKRPISEGGMGSYMFSTQYLNEPMPSESQEFRPEDLQWLSDWDPGAADPPALFQGLQYYMGVDPASGLEGVKSGDDTAVVVLGARGAGLRREHIVVEAAGGQWHTDEIIHRVFLLAEKWRPRTIGIERQRSEHLVNRLYQLMRERGLYLPIEPLKTRGTRDEKVERIRSLQPLYHAHSVWHVKKLQGSKLELQLLRFRPGSRVHDDYPDALAMAVSLVRDAGVQSTAARRKPVWRPRYPSAGY